MKKFFAFLFMCLTVSAVSVKAEGFVFDSGMITGLEGASAYAEELSIPEEIDGKKVEIIYRLESESLKRVTLPSTVNIICREAFSGCKALESINLENVKMIYGDAFRGCSALRRISADGKNTLPADCILADYAFRDCGLEELRLEGNLNPAYGRPGRGVYGRYAFSGCKGLKKLHMGENVTDLGNYAFENCPALDYICLPKNIDSVHDGVFRGCSNLRTVIFPARNVSIYESDSNGSEIFGGCGGLTIFGMANTTAEAYAKSHGISFIPSVITEKEQPALVGWARCNAAVVINGVQIPAYTVNGSVYAGENALKCFGFGFKWNREARETLVTAPEGVDIQIKTDLPESYCIGFFSSDVSFMYGGSRIPALNVGNGESIVDVMALRGR